MLILWRCANNLPKYSSASMGAIEVANRSVEAQIRTITGTLEQVLKIEINIKDPVIARIV